MGTLVGNVLGLLVVAGLGILTFFSGTVGLTTYAIASYGALFVLWSVDRSTRPAPDGSFSAMMMSEAEREFYRMFHIAIRAPGAGEVFSAFLNFLRIGGIGFAIYALATRNWLAFVALVGYFLAASGAIARFNPYLYAGVEARKGNQSAADILAGIEAIQRKRQLLGGIP
jgi:hypothetical protein